MSRKWNTKMLTEGGIMIALSILLSYIKVYEAPNGGSVTAGSMIPILFFAMRWGVGPGITVGAVFGILKCILKPWVIHPVQFLLDYPIAFGSLGLAGIFSINDKEMEAKDYLLLVLGVLLGIGGRFISSLLSGVVFYKQSAIDAGMNPWIFSIIYNGTYLLPEFIISSIILSLLYKPLSKIQK
jgi:thiamine transporter